MAGQPPLDVKSTSPDNPPHGTVRRSLARLLAVVAVVIAGVVIVVYLARTLPAYGYLFPYVYAGMILVVGVVMSRELAILVEREFTGKLGSNALVASNVVQVAGSILSAVAAASYASFSPTTLLASAAFSGLVLGLALQPTLGSFFAGILVLVSGEMKPGTQVRILSWHLPFQWAFSPGYKYFSPDQIYPGYLARVMDVGLFFTTVMTEEGQTMKIPNSILATDAAVIRYTNRDYFFNVRYEFPMRFDPEEVLRRVRDLTRDFPVERVYVNEQSDKEYYIVKVTLNARRQDHAELKSQILTKLIRLHAQLKEGEEARIVGRS
ncbi:MAG: mechanosensitive ion channel family protein [Nitrososphaerota archaeon]|nr:mechanosensitive ion channel family protein [Nitrososphaerota archaeon]